MVIGREIERIIPYKFDQMPCNHPIDIIITVKDQQGNEILQPEFIFDDRQDSKLVIRPTAQEHVGRYYIKMQATLANVLSSQAQVSFILNIVGVVSPDQTFPDIPPVEVDMFVHTQRVNVGDPTVITYRPRITTQNAYGFRSEVGLDLGVWEKRLSQVVSYDEMSNLMTLTGENATEEYAGVYSVRLVTRYYNETFS